MKEKIARVMGWLLMLSLSMTLVGCAGTRTDRSTGEYIDDQAINAKVKAALVGDKDVSALAVDVNTYRGVVQLSGFVDNNFQKTKAAEIARRINGVREVQNNISVK